MTGFQNNQPKINSILSINIKIKDISFHKKLYIFCNVKVKNNNKKCKQ